ncbi:hypothetical protein ACHAW5_010849 [Stephanodiscus triporus]|uniref:HhH-GPD domain-containing protein n=1 Tax=Stephanodiscus triporus TaxID=2934178 RepID=A0ABD3NDE9_9STRA
MTEEEGEWERPIGLTAECAILLGDSDDDDDDASRGRGRADCDESKEVGGGDGTSLPSSTTMTPKTRDDAATAREEDCGDVPTGQSACERAGDDIVDNDVNPFASFAYESVEDARSTSSSSWRRINPRPTVATENLPRNGSAIRKRPPTKGDDATRTSDEGKCAKRRRTHPLFSASAIGYDGNRGVASAAAERDGERIERRKLVERWHAFADPDASIEQRRFQVLVAARLHARCQEPVVLGAMAKLQEFFRDKDAEAHRCPTGSSSSSLSLSSALSSATKYRGLTVHSLASSDPETDIAPLLSSVLFGNTKAKQIVQAARDVLEKFGGSVPESASSLREITGIGPTLAEILTVVNRRRTFPEA